MATTPVEFPAPSGLTLTVELYPYDSDTIANGSGDSATEYTNRKGLYSADVTEAITGFHHAIVKSGSNIVATYDVYLEDTTTRRRCFDADHQMRSEVTAQVNAEADTAISDAALATAAALATVDTNVDAILVDTGTTLPATLATIAGYIDTEIASIISTLGTPAGADMAADIAAVKAETALIVADTNELQTDWANGGRLDLIIDAILVDTAEIGAAGAGLTSVGVASLSSAAITDVWSTDALTEAYAADGAAGTPAQLLYEILQSLTEFAISGTTVTVKKRDGSTTAATFTLDDATTPTSRTRAT